MIEQRQIRYLLAAVKHGIFRKAASGLGIQESNLSRRISVLEDQRSASLFKCRNGDVRPIFVGQRYLTCARKALQQIGRDAKDVAAIGLSAEGRVRIGFTDGDPADHVAAVRQAGIDVAFATGTAKSPGTSCALWPADTEKRIDPSDDMIGSVSRRPCEY